VKGARRVLAGCGIACILAAVAAAPASGSFDHHFTVSLGTRSYREIDPNRHRTKFKVRMVDADHRHVRVGRLWGVCRKPGRAVRCRFYAHLNGRVGGRGNLTIKGHISSGRAPTHLFVVRGSDDFQGARGRFTITNPPSYPHLHFDLTG
jgi:hypothetical protein